MAGTVGTVEFPLQVRLIGRGPHERVGVPCVLRYLPDDPYAVRLEFPGALTEDGEEAVWVFSRELLATGAAGVRAGQGDVRLLPGRPGRTYVQLRSGTAAALLEVGTDRLRAFLEASEASVPPGRESGRLDWDAELARLLHG